MVSKIGVFLLCLAAAGVILRVAFAPGAQLRLSETAAAFPAHSFTNTMYLPFAAKPPVPASIAYHTPVTGLHVAGNVIVNGSDQPLQLVGVNFSGAEYSCRDGELWHVPATQAAIDAMQTWHIRAVRIPLNEDCWLGINGIPPDFAAQHRQAVQDFAALLVRRNIAVIINLHYSSDGIHPAIEQEPMANRAHSLDFWRAVAETFGNQDGVIFEPYNEPYLNDVPLINGAPWSCWRDGGCQVSGSQPGEGAFTAAGMQEMVDVIRAAGANNSIIVTGLDWGADLSQWLDYRIADPQHNIIAGWHSYGDGLSCGDQTCWDSVLGPLTAQAPVVATEIGQLASQAICGHNYIDRVMGWLDTHGQQGYLAWTWGPFDCTADPALITDLNGSPTQTYGQGFKDHLLALP